MSIDSKPIYTDCTYTTRGRNKKSGRSGKVQKKGRIFKIVVCLLLVGAVILGIMENENKKDSPTIADYSRAQLKSVTTAIINQAVLDCITDSLSYGELVEIHKDNKGKISLIESNWSYLNLIARKTATVIQNKLLAFAEQGIRIPLGNLTGLPLLTGAGPEIVITVSPQDSVECRFVSEFVSAGINQTLHKIYLEVVTLVDLVMPTYETTITNSSQILITEGVIIGEVPNVYLNSAVR